MNRLPEGPHALRQQDHAVNREDNRIAVVFGLLFLGGGLLFTVGAWGAYLRDTRILEDGVRLQAQVVSLERIRDTASDGSTDYLVKYRFTAPDGTVVQKQGGLDRASWNALRVGGPVAVAYHPDDPARGLLVGGGVTSLPMVLVSSLFGLVMGAGGVALLAAVAGRFWRRRRAPA